MHAGKHLKNAYKEHSGEKPYRCTYCEQSFAHTGNVKKHLMKHTGNKSYNCKQCNQ